MSISISLLVIIIIIDRTWPFFDKSQKAWFFSLLKPCYLELKIIYTYPGLANHVLNVAHVPAFSWVETFLKQFFIIPNYYFMY